MGKNGFMVLSILTLSALIFFALLANSWQSAPTDSQDLPDQQDQQWSEWDDADKLHVLNGVLKRMRTGDASPTDIDLMKQEIDAPYVRSKSMRRIVMSYCETHQSKYTYCDDLLPSQI